MRIIVPKGVHHKGAVCREGLRDGRRYRNNHSVMTGFTDLGPESMVWHDRSCWRCCRCRCRLMYNCPCWLKVMHHG